MPNVPKPSCSKELEGLCFSFVSFTYIVLGVISDFQMHKSVDLWSLSYHAMLLPVVRVKQEVSNNIRSVGYEHYFKFYTFHSLSNTCSLFGLKFQWVVLSKQKKQSPLELVCDCGEVSAIIRIIYKFQQYLYCNKLVLEKMIENVLFFLSPSLTHNASSSAACQPSLLWTEP